ncbi:MAG TPA: hypothetical protein VL021_00330 [Brumimicrobium sp.]|nr:hypothetical protein [Flavobacterium sp.]HTO36843.1 hypothetical protein [Brumimicrobium sp.]
MKKNDLVNKLEEKGILKKSYSLEGGLPNEAYCLNKTKDGWEVYYSERGSKSGLRKFYSEDDACNYLYRLLI